MIQIQCRQCPLAQRRIRADARRTRFVYSNLSHDTEYEFSVVTINRETATVPFTVSYWTSKKGLNRSYERVACVGILNTPDPKILVSIVGCQIQFICLNYYYTCMLCCRGRASGIGPIFFQFWHSKIARAGQEPTCVLHGSGIEFESYQTIRNSITLHQKILLKLILRCNVLQALIDIQ